MGKKVSKVGTVFLNTDTSPGGVTYMHADSRDGNKFKIGRGTQLGEAVSLSIDRNGVISGTFSGTFIGVSASAGGGSGSLWTETGNDIYYNTGDVGIGTTNPATFTGYSTLTLNHATNGGVIDFQQGGSQKAQIYSYTDDLYIKADDNINFYAGANNLVTLDAGADEVVIKPADDDYFALTIFGADTTSEYLSFGIGSGVPTITAGFQGAGDAELSFRTSNLSSGEADRMRIDVSGNVGIGTTNPAASKLHIFGDVDDGGVVLKIENDSTTGNCYSGIQFRSNTGDVLIRMYEDNYAPGTGTGAVFAIAQRTNTDSLNSISFLGDEWTNNAWHDTLLVQDTDIQVGLCGKDSQLAIMATDADTWAGSLRLGEVSADYTTYVNSWAMLKKTNTTGDNSLHFKFGTDRSAANNSTYLQLSETGELFLPGIDTAAGSHDLRWDSTLGEVTYTTSRRADKTNIRDLLTGSGVPDKVGVEAITSLRPVMFNHVNGVDVDMIGFIVEEVAEVHSTLASFSKDFQRSEGGKIIRDSDGKAIQNSDELKPAMWKQDAIISHLVAAVQQLNTRTKAIENEVFDTTAPTITLSGKPDAVSTDKNPAFTFSANEAATFEVFLTGWKSWQAAVSPKTFSNLTSGTRTFSVRATDLKGNVSAPTTYTWEIDLMSNTLATFGYPDWTGAIQNPTTSSAFSSPDHTVSGSFAYNSWTGTIQNPATNSNFGTVAHSINNLFGEKHWSGTISNPTTTSNFSKPSHSIGANFNANGKLGW